MRIVRDTDVLRGFKSALFFACCALFSLTTMGAEVAPIRHVRFKEPHETTYVLDESTNKNWTTARRNTPASKPVELGNRVVLQLQPGKDLSSVLGNHRLTLSRRINSHLFILQAPDSRSAIDAAEALAAQEGVVASYPVMRRAYRHQDAYAPVPNDTYFNQQWHLENRDTNGNPAGPDLNVRAAWPVTRGAGILVAVGDVGFQLDHPELTNAANGSPHYNFFEDTPNGGPYNINADHATAVAGLIGAQKDNHRGVAGVAPQAKMASWVIFGIDFTGSENIATDEQLMDMFQYASDRVGVQNHSWGSASIELSPIDALTDTGIANAVTSGRGGKGVVIVRAGGNGRDDLSNVNDDGFSNDPRAIPVAAVRQDGRACSYSSPGACLLVGAPSGDVASGTDPGAPDVITTDRTGNDGYVSGTGDSADYTGFNGTSASSPQVAGIAALILSVNTNLTARDVQHILAQSARHYDFADPGMHTNGAGFRFSHNVGFGIPDAGFAVQLAKGWSNRPPIKQVTVESNVTLAIPDDSLRVLCAAPGISSALANIHSLPSLGVHADDPTPVLPLVYVGQANSDLTTNLQGKAALIQRGTSFFRDKIARAAQAGAAFAIIFNNTGTTELQLMGATDYSAIPAVSIGRTDGEALRDFIAMHPETTAQLQLTPVIYRFNITNTLICEHVAVRLQTTHSSRGDVRVTLVSPMGTRSVLQAINGDGSPGPTDWTYWSSQHFYESSAGQWRVEISDERSSDIGSVIYAQLILNGVEITDTDHDGLDDNWELQRFGTLSYGPKDDPDSDGFNNAREQAMGTDPTAPNSAFNLNVALLKPGYTRISWPGSEAFSYTFLSGTNVAQPLLAGTNLPGRFPVTEVIVKQGPPNQFFRVRRPATQ